MRNINRIIRQVFVFILMPFLFSACGKTRDKLPDSAFQYASFRDIPGVTDDEIKTIEELQKRGVPLIYGTAMTTEAFMDEDGELSGFSVLLCDWLAELFGLQFKMEVRDLSDVLEKLKTGGIHFAAVTVTEDRLKTYYMSDPIIHRSIKIMRIKGSLSPDEIAWSRPPRYVFVEGGTTLDSVIASFAPGSYEAVVARNHEAAYQMLASGEADAFIGTNIAEGAFDPYGGVITEDFLPLIVSAVSLAAETPDMMPVISVVTKALNNGAYKHLTGLYRQGYQAYRKNKFLMQLSDEEREYVRNTPVIPFAAQYMSYPVSFYSVNEKKWEGVIFDILDEMKNLAGFKFELVNDETTELPELMNLLEKGTAYIMPNLIQSDERRKRFIWPGTMYQMDRFALLSKRSFPNVELNDIPFTRVGYAKGSAFGDMFRSWFPDVLYATEYPNTDDAFMALENGEVDLVMSSQSRLASLTNYYEMSDYKANYLFSAAFEASFGLNKDQTVLCSIIDKALPQIDTGRIVEQWMSRTYNIEAMRLRKQRPWLFGSIALIFCVLALIAVLFQRSRRAGRKLEKLVDERTRDLEKQTSLLAAIGNSSPDFIFCKDLNSRYTQCNKSMEDFFNVSTEDIIGKDDMGAFRFSPEIAQRFVNEDQRIINEKRPIVFEELALMRSDGGKEIITETIKAPLIQNGEITGVMGISRDITKRKEMEEAALAASRSKSVFLANMSHEIRTPMNSIIGFSELAMDSEPSKTKEYLSKIQINADWLLQIINDILDISKIESGKLELENIPFDMHELFESCRTLIMPKAVEKGIKLQFYAEPSVGKRPLGDPTRLRQIFVNLLSNAVKFTNSGTIKVFTEIREEDEKTVTFHFEIKDSGIGMTEEQIKRIFEPFMQGESGTTRKYGGTGLGLAICKNFIELMGGKLAVESTPGVGSKFSFDLEFDTINISGYEKFERKAVLDEIEKPVFEGEVLLCEDNVMNQQVICEHLARVGLKTVVAENGRIGIKEVQSRIKKGKKQFDLVFMDIHMPVMDGIETAVKIVELEKGIPIVAMTANIMSSDMETYRESGMRDCIGKPFTSQELWRCLLKYLAPVDREKRDIYTPQKNTQIEEDHNFQKGLKLLFAGTNQGKYREIEKALEDGDISLANRLAHSLKTNAGHIDKHSLRQAAGIVEQMLKDGKNLVTAEQMKKLETELGKVLEELAPLLKETSAQTEEKEASALEPGKAMELLEKLESLLKAGNSKCLSYIDNLRAVAGSDHLIEQIENFDFESAVTTLAELKEMLEV